MTKSSKIILAMVLVIAIALAFGGGFFAGQYTSPSPENGLSIVEEAWNHLKTDYVEPSKLASENITRGAIEGIIAALDDPHMSYISAKDMDIVKSNFEGSFEGIGAVVSIREDKLTIVSPIKGTPAEAAGIRAGDVILEINGESTEGMSVDIAVGKIRGAAGTVVSLLVLHEDAAEPVVIEITRAVVEMDSVYFEMRGDIALMTISQFTNRTETELEKIMPKLDEENARGIILDLRGNPGGILNIVIEVASHFITDGVIVSVRSNQGVIETYNAKDRDITTDLPMVVLVDEGSASGSEVLTGALQDHHRAFIAGTVTYGKGSVNILQPLSDGSGIYITTSRWLTPDGHLIEGQGIQPDVTLDITGEEEIQWAIDYLHGE